jgi:hypothetical protein
MRKTLGMLFASAIAATFLCTAAQAWDSCGRGLHRNFAGVCVSNFGPTSAALTGTIWAGTSTPASTTDGAIL